MCGRFYVDPEDEYFRELAGRISSSPLTDRFRGKLPANADGTLNLIEFTAWLLKEVNRNGSEPDQT